ncbi:Vesicle-associated membrane protein 722 [Acorus gramineus]|uniref:Vesicle-associated membrane protein 722 n=1 Tax=Acorus gramineus TaxID=55184 RepID=A0AAV9A200_ACOGR|nr:Vesicle-associated membrane protein 722 [Acorus gramineus]
MAFGHGPIKAPVIIQIIDKISQVPIAFLERVKEDFNKRYGREKTATAMVNSLNKEFGHVTKILLGDIRRHKRTNKESSACLGHNSWQNLQWCSSFRLKMPSFASAST